MKKIIRIIVGNSAYTDDSGFGYSALKVRDLKDNQLKKIYKEYFLCKKLKLLYAF